MVVTHQDCILLSSLVHSTNPETRIRYWNAYMLFYEAINRPQKLVAPRKLSASEATSPLSPQPEDDKLSQLQVSCHLVRRDRDIWLNGLVNTCIKWLAAASMPRA